MFVFCHQNLFLCKVILNGGEYTTLTQNDGEFSFYNIPSGVYHVDVMCTKYAYASLKVKLDADNNKMIVVEYKYPGD